MGSDPLSQGLDAWFAMNPLPTRWRRLRWAVSDWLDDCRWSLGMKLQRLSDWLLFGPLSLPDVEPDLSPPEPEAPVITPTLAPAPPGDFFGMALSAYLQDQAGPNPVWCDLMAERALAWEIADFYGLDRGQVWNQLGRLPQNYTPLLDSPQGWSVIADWIAADLGAARDGVLRPTVN